MVTAIAATNVVVVVILAFLAFLAIVFVDPSASAPPPLSRLPLLREDGSVRAERDGAVRDTVARTPTAHALVITAQRGLGGAAQGSGDRRCLGRLLRSRRIGKVATHRLLWDDRVSREGPR
jgi:hypothetical protein